MSRYVEEVIEIYNNKIKDVKLKINSTDDYIKLDTECSTLDKLRGERRDRKNPSHEEFVQAVHHLKHPSYTLRNYYDLIFKKYDTFKEAKRADVGTSSE